MTTISPRPGDGTPPEDFVIDVVAGADLRTTDADAIAELCRRAYGEPLSLTDFPDPHHVIGRCGAAIVSHALWVTRWLQVGEGPLLRTAYVEAVATDPRHRRLGFGTQVMRSLAARVTDYDLAALSPAVADFYRRLGWVAWRGPLSIRSSGGLVPTPDEDVMIMRLSRSPHLDIGAPLSVEWRSGELW